jgi:hypothetical protein
VIQALKRYFPDIPDWVFGGFLLVLLLWLVVLPAELIQIMRPQHFPNFLFWSIKFFYSWGYAISLFTIAPLLEYSSASGQLTDTLFVLSSLCITSPVYFLMGAFLAARKESMMALGVGLATVHLVASCLVSVWLAVFLFSS